MVKLSLLCGNQPHLFSIFDLLLPLRLSLVKLVQASTYLWRLASARYKLPFRLNLFQSTFLWSHISGISFEIIAKCPKIDLRNSIVRISYWTILYALISFTHRNHSLFFDSFGNFYSFFLQNGFIFILLDHLFESISFCVSCSCPCKKSIFWFLNYLRILIFQVPQIFIVSLC